MSILINENGADLFTIPNESWVVINQWVGEIFTGRGFVPVLTKVLPAYPAGLKSCELWTTKTYPQLILQSEKLSTYAKQAIDDFSDLNTKVKSIRETPVPVAIQHQTIAVLDALIKRTAPLAKDFSILENQLSDFLTANIQLRKQMDTEIEAAFFEKETLVFEQALRRLNGTWLALYDDLRNVNSTPIDPTLPFIESLNIDAAIIQWENIQKEAEAFPIMAVNQEELWEF